MRRRVARCAGIVALFGLVALATSPFAMAAQDAASPVAVEPTSTPEIEPAEPAAGDPETEIPVVASAVLSAGMDFVTCPYRADAWVFQILNFTLAEANPTSIEVQFATGTVVVARASNVSPPGGVHIATYVLSSNLGDSLLGAAASGVDGVVYNFVLTAGPQCQVGSTTPTALASVTRTPSRTPVPPSATPSHTVTPTQTASATTTKTATLTPSATVTHTASATPTATASATRSHTASPTPVIPSATATATATATPTVTASASVTRTVSPTASASSTATATATRTPSAVPTHTATATASRTVTDTVTATATSTHSATSTATVTMSSTATVTESPTASATITPFGELVVTTNVNCRVGPSTGTASLGVVAKGTALPMRGPTTGGWTPVRCFGTDGWISAQYGATMTPTAPPSRTPTMTPTRLATGTAVTTTRVNCRTAPSTSASVIVVVNGGTTVAVRGAAQSGWTPVVCGSQNGWISSQYLRTG